MKLIMKKLLYVNTWMHPKNNHSMMNYKNIEIHEIKNVELLDTLDLSRFDCIYSPSTHIHVSKYPNSKFLFGPHFSTFPERTQMNIIRGPNVTYTQPSEWASKIWRNNPLCKDIRIELLPFGVDTERFKPDVDGVRDLVFVYFKGRHPNTLTIIKSFLKAVNSNNYLIFNYNAKYNENEYIECLKKCKYGIWIGTHESQGFALEEALSMNVPLLVWNVKSINEEYGCNYPEIPATTIPYWDHRCGESFTELQDLPNIFNVFISKLETYKPREYILENLTMEICEKRLIELM